uniref:Uncharacterized protein n=1 Tax=Oryza barthii TaxID=65489 RepID=A0A0D3HSY3_9ORYZ
MAIVGKERNTSANAPRREKYAQCVDQARLSPASHPLPTTPNRLHAALSLRWRAAKPSWSRFALLAPWQCTASKVYSLCSTSTLRRSSPHVINPAAS